MTPEQRLNEIGALCIGLTKHSYVGLHGPVTYGKDEDGNGQNFPDISLSDPPTDAQIANVQRLTDRAVDKDATAFGKELDDRHEYGWRPSLSIGGDGIDRMVHRMVAESFHSDALNDRRDTALKVLCPPDMTEELERLLEGE